MPNLAATSAVSTVPTSASHSSMANRRWSRRSVGVMLRPVGPAGSNEGSSSLASDTETGAGSGCCATDSSHSTMDARAASGDTTTAESSRPITQERACFQDRMGIDRRAEPSLRRFVA